MSDIFGREYARSYDALSVDRDFVVECDLIETLVRTYASAPVRTVLDLGCGTGGHATVLAARGYSVTGVDRSEWMIGEARQKSGDQTTAAVFTCGDARHVNLGRTFDLVSMVGGMLDYQLTDEDVVAVLMTARRHLDAGSLLLFTVWYGPAVERQRPSERMKAAQLARGEVRRSARGELDVERRLCTVSFSLTRTEMGRSPVVTDETHTVRYFDAGELDRFLQAAGFTSLRVSGFPEIEREPDETTWNLLVVARAV
jgi:predicted TPR repeat methyltransferase